jgi:putative transcriptional regulator
MDFLNQHIPIRNQKPATGKLLIAEPFLADPNFSRTVVLLCEHGAQGTVGFVLNRSTQLTLGDLLPELYTPELSVYQGGPVQLDTLHMIHRNPGTLGGNEIAPGVYWGGSYETLQQVIENNEYDAADMKMYIGYSGWSQGQLEKEMAEGTWLVGDADPYLLFDTPQDMIWKEAIRLLGKEFTYLANMPLNPQLN